ncbi:homeobox protein CDX-2 [Patagioenas fasciata monilis]|uniref:Homeobox protein CDX-2 n=1 Tax=Patagioenas fasciata monilis TaxID=372326 RepID=A0A1V4K9K5_PATFA|nr:homeobox protein CDX-2 [Patagioenas fasciata monilis]
MYVSYLLEKDGPMYPGPVRHSGGLNLAAQNFVGAPQYADYGGYHVNLDSTQSPGPAWPAPYAAPLRDDWGAYGQGAPPAASAVHGLNGGSPAAAMAYSPADYHHHHHHHHPHAHHHAGPAPHCSAGVMQPLNAASAAAAAPEPLSPGGQRRGLCEWVRKPAQPPLSSQVKTRTKDKYRVVYTDHQRLELEKEFHYSRYITIRRKAELASNLGLSERQVKIWFQNRRAKERKINKKKLQQAQPGGAEPLSPGVPLQGPAAGAAAAGLGPAAPQ